MTTTLDAMFPLERPSRWNVLFAENTDKDLDFDEGFEEDDELHQSKPPSRRPLLWILLLLLVAGGAYWVLNNPSMPGSNLTDMNSVEDTNLTVKSDVPSPLFGEGTTVRLTEETGGTMLMGNPTNSQPGPMVQANKPMTILDGSYQLQGWVYQVKTESGETGWVSEEKLKR
jgi:hypothetical protein